jgi:CRP-like cAMP-binding protein
MDDDELDTALIALGAAEREYAKDEVILHAGSTTDMMGLVLGGSVRIESNDIWGNRTILSHIAPGQVFAETYAIVENAALLVDAVANRDSRVLMLSIGSAGFLRQDSSLWRIKLTANILGISMQKNLMLSRRSFHTSPKSIRGRVMSYLSSVSLQTGSDEFDIPFDRQQLADYLNVERTALSKEIGKMKQDGMLTARKNHFRILKSGTSL